jgi:membrane protease YdiL (CAAX protease family)
MSERNGGGIGTSFPWLFFVLTFGLSWALWLPFVVSGREVSLFAIAGGAFAPTVSGILLAWLCGNSRDFWKRVVSFRSIGGKWYAVVFLLFPVLVGLSLFIDFCVGGTFYSLQSAAATLTHPIALLSFVVMMLVGGPLAEELGWRGYALDPLQHRWNALTSSLFLGLMWGLWHLPLFFMKGTTQNEMGFLSLRFWMFFVQVLALSILFTWVYNNTRRSTLSAILMHFMTNSSVTLIVAVRHALPQRIELIRTGLLIGAAIVVVLIFGSSSLTTRTRLRQARTDGHAIQSP